MAVKKADFVARDRELEAAHEKSTEELAKHRWHWTLDESNPERVSYADYARGVARAESTIRMMAKAYAVFRVPGTRIPGGPATLNEFMRREHLDADKIEAVQAVAAATGKTFGGASHSSMRSEVRDVLATAQDRALRKGTTVSEELPAVAEWREKGRRMTEVEREAKAASPFRLVSFEGHIGTAIRQLRAALALARDIEFTDEEIELMEGSLTTLRTLIQLIDVRISGESGIDWDASFAEVMKEPS